MCSNAGTAVVFLLKTMPSPKLNLVFVHASCAFCLPAQLWPVPSVAADGILESCCLKDGMYAPSKRTSTKSSSSWTFMFSHWRFKIHWMMQLFVAAFCFSPYPVVTVTIESPDRTWPFPKQALVFTCQQYKSFENTKEKGENWWAISPFPTVFSTRLEYCLSFLSNLKLYAVNSLSLEGSKICCLGTG